LTNNKIKNEICFCVGATTAKALELKKIKNIVIAEIPTIEDVIVEVIEYNTEESIEPSAKI
jgi:uroporphyrinogen-III synthase